MGGNCWKQYMHALWLENGQEAASAPLMHEVTPVLNVASQQVWLVPCS